MLCKLLQTMDQHCEGGKVANEEVHLYWTPCAAHCIDLMFEDIAKRPTVSELITNARKSPTSSTIMVVACESEKGLWWRYCASGGNKICNKLHRP